MRAALVAFVIGVCAAGAGLATASPWTDTQTASGNVTAGTWLPAQIDIKPGGEPNSINLGSEAVIPVAILTTASFDATTVDPATVCFGDEDAPGERDCSETHGTGHIRDVDRDRDRDLLLHYETVNTGIDLGDTQACLRGETFGGTPVVGCDTVRTLP